jgi:hypothetical protein
VEIATPRAGASLRPALTGTPAFPTGNWVSFGGANNDQVFIYNGSHLLSTAYPVSPVCLFRHPCGVFDEIQFIWRAFH